MTLNDVFNKVDVYNELAGMMGGNTLHIYFYDRLGPYENLKYGEHVKTYDKMCKYVRETYIKELAVSLLNYDGWEMNTERNITEFGCGLLSGSSSVIGIYLCWD